MKVSLYGPARHPRAKEAQPQEVISTGRQHHLGAALRAAPVSFFSTKPRCPRPSCRIGYVCISDSGGRARKTAITILIQKYGEVIHLARKDIKSKCSDVDAPASGKPDKDKQHEYQPNDKWATYSGAKGESQSPHPLCFVRHFPECDDAA
jgi:hypothetical protein